MKSIKSIYKIGNGPSSSHTVGPYNAAVLFKNRYPQATNFKVILYGSLALTGEGHSTTKAITSILPDAEIIVDYKKKSIPHPNTMLFQAYENDRLIGENLILSVGGGSIEIVGESSNDDNEIYQQKNFSEMMKYCQDNSLSILQFIYQHEDKDIKNYLTAIWHAMETTIENGIQKTGVLPGGLNVSRKAKTLYEKRCYNESADVSMNRIIASYAFAMSEENASENVVVTAPTCGSCGVIPSVLYYMRHDRGFPENEIVDALAVAGLLGNVIRTNASISGAECGCQAEIGSACSMAAGALAFLFGLSLDQIEYAAEIAMEHSLGLTCDPVNGLVQIPCIERNAVAAMRAISAVNLSRFLAETRKISFDDVVSTMYQTGKDLNEKYRETSHGGLAQMYQRKNS